MHVLPHEFDPLLGYFVPRKPASGGGGALGVVKRSLSFGKRRRERGGDKGKDEPPTPRTAESAQGTPRGIPALSTAPPPSLVALGLTWRRAVAEMLGGGVSA